MTFPRLIAAYAALGALSALAQSGTPQPAFADAADAALQGAVERKATPGLVVLVGDREGIAYHGTAGFQDIGQEIPMPPDAVFRLASLTKPITAVAALTLVADGRIGLDEPIFRHLPEFREMRRLEPDWLVSLTSWRTRRRLHTRVSSFFAPYKSTPVERPITLRLLLSQQSGIPGVRGEPTAFAMSPIVRENNADQTLEGAAAALAKIPLHFEPGERWLYGEAYEVTARLIEVVSGRPFAEYVHDRILEPLEMNDTTFFLDDRLRKRLAVAYVLDDFGNDFDVLQGFWGADWPNKPGRYASGGWGLNGTAADYARFCRMMLRGGELDGTRILPERLVAEMTRNQLRGRLHWISFEDFGYGLGVRVREREADPPLSSVGSWGWFGHIGTFFWVDSAADGFGIILTQRPEPPTAVIEQLQALTRKYEPHARR